jgi:DNA-binding NarL/FixJ family response regulator
MELTTSRAWGVILVDDHPLVRYGLRVMVERCEGLTVLGEAGNGTEAEQLLERFDPDLVILDLKLRQGNGMSLIRRFKSIRPRVRVLIVSVLADGLHVDRALRAGASGYVIKDDAVDDVALAVEYVRRGEVYVSPSLMPAVLERRWNASVDGGEDRLSEREREIVRLIGGGWKVSAIAHRLGISPKTVNNHRDNIKQKLGLSTSIELAQWAALWIFSGSGSKEPDVELRVD